MIKEFGRMTGLLLGLLFLSNVHAEAQHWHLVQGNLTTRWSLEVDPARPLPEYPRPQMVRPRWQNLNGLWNFTLTDKDAATPSAFPRQILVPFPIESALSGVKEPLLPTQNLWYQRDFDRPPMKAGERLLLHFGAVDFEATAFVNGHEVGRHKGGYQNFTFDITQALKKGKNDLTVKVWDPTDQGRDNPRGKQALRPEDIFYTATSGIWQTVWLETVPATYIHSLILTPEVDHSLLRAQVESDAGEGYTVKVLSGKARVTGAPNEALSLTIPRPHLWSASDPYLYDLQVRLVKQGKVVDSVNSYFGMRKVEIKKDAQGKPRIYLNDRYTYNLGVLDQGYWPDGLYTAPTDAALKYDVETIKSMGFNTIRKHIKIEPARWYYYCDKLGLMVWQDMVPPAGKWNNGLPTQEARTQFEAEVKENIAQLHNVPSITTWVLFNESAGGYDQNRLEGWLKELDPSRLVNGHSGWVILSNGTTVELTGTIGAASDLTDIHSYPSPAIVYPLEGKAAVLGEYGGLSVAVKDHMWIDLSAKPWAYEQLAAEELPSRYAALIEAQQKLKAEGLTASIYTQPFDVEIEQNGLITYDREVMKIPLEEIRRLNANLTAD
jgi:beta-galactosidase/beta-glucuronidase